MKFSQTATTFTRPVLDSFETLKNQVASPIGQEAFSELFGTKLGGLSRKPQEMASEDLKRARNQQKIEEMETEANQKSQEKVQKVIIEIKQKYRDYQIKTEKEDRTQQEQVIELKEEVVKLAKAAGVNSKIHLENTPQKGKVSLQTIKLLVAIIKTLRLKAEESKSAQELVSQRNNAKRTTGMLAWVSGKQMKVHEQGTLQLQG